MQDDVVQKKIFAICVYFDECYCDEGKVTRSATLHFTSLDTSQIRQIKSEVLCLPFCNDHLLRPFWSTRGRYAPTGSFWHAV